MVWLWWGRGRGRHLKSGLRTRCAPCLGLSASPASPLALALAPPTPQTGCAPTSRLLPAVQFLRPPNPIHRRCVRCVVVCLQLRRVTTPPRARTQRTHALQRAPHGPRVSTALPYLRLGPCGVHANHNGANLSSTQHQHGGKRPRGLLHCAPLKPNFISSRRWDPWR
ncbi:hypothetical protein EDC01DRAFT_356010 [Geopyxis carbonaria]|nr:hypothetical protein EDC01DRAFT_356010 [Geopyxis carbonaria]